MLMPLYAGFLHYFYDKRVGVVGYVTNYVGVSMLFYPIAWTGIPVRRWPNQPLGLFGWQGIVPAKRFAMANKLVSCTAHKLISFCSTTAIETMPTIISTMLFG